MSVSNPEPSIEETAEAKHRRHVRQVVTMVRWLLYLVFVVIAFVVLRHQLPYIYTTDPNVIATGPDGEAKSFQATVRIDTHEKTAWMLRATAA